MAVGRFVEKKAPYATVLAFADALKTCPEAKLAMVSDGPLLNTCKQMAVGLGIGQSVVFTGVQSPEQILHLIGLPERLLSTVYAR